MQQVKTHVPQMQKPQNPRSAATIPFKNLDSAAEIAYYYGFLPIEAPRIEKDDVAAMKKMGDADEKAKNYSEDTDCELLITSEEKAALLRHAEQKNLLSPAAPLMTYYEGVPKRFDSDKRAKSSYKRFNLDVLGTNKSVAEAELIKASLEILRDAGFEDLYVDVNSLGDKESLQRFTKDLGAYFRKHAGDLEAQCRQTMKKDVFPLLDCDNEKCRDIATNAPKSVAFLSEPSRMHFKEVLEYLESMNVPYKIDHALVGNRKLCCHTVFLIKTLNPEDPKKETTLALGFRYNTLAKKLEMKKDIPAAGVTIIFKKLRNAKSKRTHTPKKPKVYFIQIGFDAKRKSLEVIEMLRRAKIPVHQALSKDKFSSQIATAENMGVPFVLIMGQKETLEGSVIVRNMQTRFQETVLLPNLVEYLKKVKAF